VYNGMAAEPPCVIRWENERINMASLFEQKSLGEPVVILMAIGDTKIKVSIPTRGALKIVETGSWSGKADVEFITSVPVGRLGAISVNLVKSEKAVARRGRGGGRKIGNRYDLVLTDKHKWIVARWNKSAELPSHDGARGTSNRRYSIWEMKEGCKEALDGLFDKLSDEKIEKSMEAYFIECSLDKVDRQFKDLSGWAKSFIAAITRGNKMPSWAWSAGIGTGGKTPSQRDYAYDPAFDEFPETTKMVADTYAKVALGDVEYPAYDTPGSTHDRHWITFSKVARKVEATYLLISGGEKGFIPKQTFISCIMYTADNVCGAYANRKDIKKHFGSGALLWENVWGDRLKIAIRERNSEVKIPAVLG